MSKLEWGLTGNKVFQTGVDHGVLYVRDAFGRYPEGVAWGGLVSVSEAPSGGESNKQYADNQVYLNLQSAEDFSATVEAFYYPDEFEACDGTASPVPGFSIGQQNRKPFGLSWRSLLGNDVDGTDYGYKIHFMWGGLAAPSEKAHNTVNETPEATTFSWEISTTPVSIPGFKASAHAWIDSTKMDPDTLAVIEGIVYGTEGEDARLPLPGELLQILQAGNSVEVTPTAPTFDDATNTVTIPTITGVQYRINGEAVTGNVVLTEDTLVVARPLPGHKFPEVTDVDWLYEV